jgi:hypothetical protein
VKRLKLKQPSYLDAEAEGEGKGDSDEEEREGVEDVTTATNTAPVISTWRA